MSTLRRHPLTGEWVLVAPNRGWRPHAFDTREERARTAKSDCPFCPGNEQETPPEILRKGTSDRWELRVVPNRYPAIEASEGGAHEVVIESRNHNDRFEDLTLHHAAMVIGTYTERYRALTGDHRLRYITIFKNGGKDSGQSIDHLHSQILGLPIIPPRAAEPAGRFEDSGCVLCELGSREDLVFSRTAAFQLMAAPVPLFPYEQWLIPTSHTPSFVTLGSGEIGDLAHLMQQAVRATGRLLDGPSFNWIFHNSPIPESNRFHWFLQLFPRLVLEGGFELGSGMQISIVEAERAAKDKNRQEELIKASRLDWTIVRPGFLTHGRRTGDYRVVTDLAGVRARMISRADVADFLIRSIERGEHIRAAVLLTT